MKRIMRCFSWRAYILCALIVNLNIAAMMWYYLDNHCQCVSLTHNFGERLFMMHQINEIHSGENITNSTEAQISSKLLFLIRDFEFFDNDVTETVKSIASVLPQAKVLIISDKTIYPPLTVYKDLPKFDVQVISLKRSTDKSESDFCMDRLITRNHILMIPDGVRFENKEQVFHILENHFRNPHNIIAVPVEGEKSECLELNVNLRHWTLKYKKNKKDKPLCDAVQGQHVILCTKTLFMRLSHPFARPFPDAFFVQTVLSSIKVDILKNQVFHKGKPLFQNRHLKWKRDTLEMARKKEFYNEFGIKKVLLPASKIEWYGCNKKTPRCFGTVSNDMPDYLFEGRWTPPCCMENLRQTARYVFSILEKCNVRYWLEGGSLLGAARNGDIIPWDYDVDIGIYKEDITKCEWLKNCQKQSIIDNQGFVWEKAHEGDFIRVQFSQSNHLHVDIFPFYSKNGVMTKNTWFSSHKQDMEFPEHFLQPLETLKFVGVKASVPNNHKKFLELKFGKGAILSPKYPAPEMLAYAKKSL